MKPMLAATLKHLNEVRYPVCVTPKIDGIRCLVVDGKALTRSGKAIPNHHVRAWVEAHLPEGIDGELVVDGGFWATSRAIMTATGTPDFHFVAFDYVADGDLAAPYVQRVTNLVGVLGQFLDAGGAGVLQSVRLPQVHLLVPQLVTTQTELEDFENTALTLGYEGIMLRAPRGRYKCGRSTLNEHLLVKRKLFLDAEAEVIGFDEEKTQGTLGAFVCRELLTGIEFRCGSGLTAALSLEVWANRDQFMGQIVKFRFFPYGMQNSFRHPTFVGFRDSRDMG